MKYIKSINEFFDFLKKDDEEDKIAAEFANRLKKAEMGDNPYHIELCKGYLSNDNVDGVIPTYFKHVDMFNWIYLVKFDDVDLACGLYVSLRGGGNHYALYIDGERINYKDKYEKGIFNSVHSIHSSTKHKSKLDKLKNNINPAADLL